MTRFATSTLLALLGSTACTMTNPAFGDEPDNADDVGDATSSETRGSEESSDSGSSSSSDTVDTSDAVDTVDTGDQPDTSDESIEVDLPNEDCPVAFSDPYAPIYGIPAAFNPEGCPLSVPVQHLKVIGPGPSPGVVMGQRCSDGCFLCDGVGVPLGVVGLDDFSAPLLVQNGTQHCLGIQTGQLTGVLDGVCVYDALWVGENDGNLLLAVRESALPPEGLAMLSGKPPPGPGQTSVSCACAAFYNVLKDPDGLDCCEAAMELPAVSSLAFLDVDVLPGDTDVVTFDSVDFTFHVAQAQSPPSCEPDIDNALDVSWALVRVSGG